MDFDEIERRARSMTDRDMAVQLRSLIEDERFAALVRQLILQRDGYIKSGWHQKVASHHGVLAHTAGSAFALDTCLSHLRQISTFPHPDAKRRSKSQS